LASSRNWPRSSVSGGRDDRDLPLPISSS
jgi:hypothetical protein